MKNFLCYLGNTSKVADWFHFTVKLMIDSTVMFTYKCHNKIAKISEFVVLQLRKPKCRAELLAES